jgi:hypothetical protein
MSYLSPPAEAEQAAYAQTFDDTSIEQPGTPAASDAYEIDEQARPLAQAARHVPDVFSHLNFYRNMQPDERAAPDKGNGSNTAGAYNYVAGKRPAHPLRC